MSTTLHAPSFNRYPLAVIAAAFAAGVALAHLVEASLAASLVCGMTATLAASLAWHKGKNGAATVALIFAFICAGASFESLERRAPDEARLRAFYDDGRIAPGDPVEVTGTVERAPESSPDGISFAMRVERIRFRSEEQSCHGRVELFAPVRSADERELYHALELRRGARVRVAARFGRIERFRNPGVETLAERLERRDTDARATIKSRLLIERLDDERIFLPLYLLDEWRRRAIQSVDDLFAPDEAGVLKAAMFGDRRGLTRETAERFREGGTFHVLVVSGLHVTLVGGLVWAVARLITRRRLWQWTASAACVWGYALAVGAESSVVRAALMLSAASLAPALGRSSSALGALGGAALVLLVWRPSSLFDPSFQLTFVAVLAIVSLALPLLMRMKDVGEWRPARETPRPPVCHEALRGACEMLFWRERAWRREMSQATYSYRLFKTRWAARLEAVRVQAALRWVFSVLMVTTAVQAALLPLLILYFHRLPLAAPLLNVWTGPLLAAGCASTLVALIFSTLGGATAASALAAFAETFTRLAAHGVDPFAEAGVASLRVPEYTGAARLVYALYFVPLAALASTFARRPSLAAGIDESEEDERAKRRRLCIAAGAMQTALALIIVLHPSSAPRPDGRLRVAFLDVGQGDSALVTLPDATTLLVDGGGLVRFGSRSQEAVDEEPFEPDASGIGERVVSEFLWHRGLDRVNFLLATHPDADHIEGLNDVLANFAVDALLVARAPFDDAEFARLAASAARRRVPVYMIARGDLLRFGATTIEVLWPPAVTSANAPAGNDDSIVLRLTLGRRAFLLTGDIEAKAEAVLASSDGVSLACDVLKVAHHGSRTSTTEKFLLAARPTLAVIPAPLDSPHGHPHEQVVKRLRSIGARVLTTGESGAVTVSTNGEDLRVETYVRD